MIKSAVTISLVPEARGGPFVFWDLKDGCRQAKALGFDAVELFAPDAKTLRDGKIRQVLGDFGLKLAAAGTGAGWVRQKLTLTSADSSVRQRAREFLRSMVDAAGELRAPAIVGSMQGRFAGEGDPSFVDGKEALGFLLRDLSELANAAGAHGVPLLYEPLNRYETNLLCSVHDAANFLKTAPPNLKILVDLFHMNIEDRDLARAIRHAGARVGHVHFADSNRRPVGLGHTDMAPVVAALKDIGYEGYVSAECLPYPDSDQAARQTMDSFRKFFR